jgi:hypothetical protein
MFRLLASSCLVSCLLSSCAAPPAPLASQAPANQLDLSETACGPAALLNALRFGSADWQRLALSIPGNTDQQRLSSLLRKVELLPSHTIHGQTRGAKRGVNVADLKELANVLTKRTRLPAPQASILFLKSGESLPQLLHRSHALLSRSARDGLPPIISLRRYAWRTQKGGGATWTAIGAHFVTLSSIPQDLSKDATSYPVSYIDPWGGKIHQGRIHIPTQPVLAATADRSPCLEVIFPDAEIGQSWIPPGEVTVITLAAAIGLW